MSGRAQRPFWLHQLVEYMIGLILVATGLQGPEPLVPAVVGGVVLLNAAVAIGPLGAFRLVGRRLHRVLDLVAIAFVVVAAVQPWVDVDVGTRAIMIGIAFVYGFVWFYSDFAEKQERKQRRAAATGDRGEDLGRTAGRLAGNAVTAWRRRKPER
ncbi:MAG TPA: hypothetical protein VFV63_08510 [Ilumatobacteraceae bacterium]|nr:hypothetical protein [Ilumatobacteraceae bacterium]